jgi:Ulp1 family protease
MYLSDQTNSIIRGNNTFIKVKLFLKKYATNMNLTESDLLYSNIDEYQEIHLKGECPQQTNGYDCGVFGLTYIDSLLNENYYFSQNNMVDIRKNLLAFAVLGSMFK